jgi:hypothetical protein
MEEGHLDPGYVILFPVAEGTPQFPRFSVPIIGAHHRSPCLFSAKLLCPERRGRDDVGTP